MKTFQLQVFTTKKSKKLLTRIIIITNRNSGVKLSQINTWRALHNNTDKNFNI